jgi:glycosyltransferase involved in cell wall biosynthesis
MRLALTHAYSWPEVRRGAERIIRELSLALVARGHRVTVLSAGRPIGRERGPATILRTPRFSQNAVRHERLYGAAITPLLAAGRYDAVHSMGPTDALAAIRASRVHHHRTIYTQLGLPFHWAWDNDPHRAAHERVVADIDVYGCMSRHALQALEDEYGRTGALTPGGVNLKQFVPAKQREAKPTILFSGAVSEPRKGAHTLLAALPLIAAEEPEVQLWLSGPGDASKLLSEAPAEARARTEVLPLGDPDGQAERYGRAWVTSLPSKWDSFGMVLIEALACGTPIATSTHSALPELVDPGVTGALCEPDDPVSLARAVIECIALSRRSETAEACRASAAPYDWLTGIAPDFEKFYAGG